MMTPIEDLIPLEVFEDLQMLAEMLEFEEMYSPTFMAEFASLPYTVGR